MVNVDLFIWPLEYDSLEVTVQGERAFWAARISLSTFAIGGTAVIVALRRILNGE